MNIWNLQSKQLQQTIELDPFDGCMSLAIRFLHNPDCNHAFASSAIGSAIYHIYMDSVHGLLDRLAIYVFYLTILIIYSISIDNRTIFGAESYSIDTAQSRKLDVERYASNDYRSDHFI